MYVYVSVWVYAMCEGAYGNRRGQGNPTELELEVVVSHRHGPENWTSGEEWEELLNTEPALHPPQQVWMTSCGWISHVAWGLGCAPGPLALEHSPSHKFI